MELASLPNLRIGIREESFKLFEIIPEFQEKLQNVIKLDIFGKVRRKVVYYEYNHDQQHN